MCPDGDRVPDERYYREHEEKRRRFGVVDDHDEL